MTMRATNDIMSAKFPFLILIVVGRYKSEPINPTMTQTISSLVIIVLHQLSDDCITRVRVDEFQDASEKLCLKG
jgi:hypothetical protein